ncbi:hypothetical protein BDV36DRAFT_250476 [Aspergillus pseudocaelatus]|uniref:Uncharacterized protein n=1 Tax=Aspergillus pseudocaelatus TaxID=1825620 RepID=A0ABQ6WRU9_9EURO|nr:hypothetical protein BDV36DRAFT_250476 [Aspergillus pseudocaelatus]
MVLGQAYHMGFTKELLHNYPTIASLCLLLFHPVPPGLGLLTVCQSNRRSLFIEVMLKG